MMFVVAPLQAMGLTAAHYFGIAFAPVLIVTVFVVSRSLAAVAAILIAVAMIVAAAVFAPGRITLHRIIGAVLLYLNIGIVFMALFSLVSLMVPDAFTGLGPMQDNLAVASNLIYFSFVTLTSVGYGDIVPLHPFARSLANIEAIIGQLYPATLLARLVTLEIEGRRGK